MANIGVLALQGDFAKHVIKVSQLKHTPILVREPEQLHTCDALIIPGGESTVMLRHIERQNFSTALHNFTKPIFGTCAGLILMAKNISSHKQHSFGWLDITIERNAYGRQTESFQTSLKFQHQDISAIFIRAPRITKTGSVEVLAHHNGEPVLVRQGKYLGASFHPELTDDLAVHDYFLNSVL